MPVIHNHSLQYIEFCVTNADILMPILGRTDMTQRLGNWKHRLLSGSVYVDESTYNNNYYRLRPTYEKLTIYPSGFNSNQHHGFKEILIVITNFIFW